MFVKIPAARKPERIFDMVFPACQMAIRIGFSSFVYQEDVTGPHVRLVLGYDVNITYSE
jgi:hypothetical protein